ncbi:MAG: hypothetical protein WKG00_32265 [Polyangiaceae bacterium]
MVRESDRMAVAHGRLGAALLVCAGVLALTACGGDDGDGAPADPEEEDCLLAVTLSGALSETLDYDDSAGCSGSSTDVYTALSWGGFEDSAPINFGVFINGSITAPSTGNLASVQITSADGQVSWETPDTCRVDITESTVIEVIPEIGTDYALQGKGTCSEPAVDNFGDGGEVTVGSFTFRAGTLVP